MVFHGQESENVENLKQEGGHLGEGYPTMWVSCGVLAITIVVIGILGPRLEHFLQEGFQYNLVERLHLPVEHAKGHSMHGSVPLLSVIFVVVGAVPAYLLYISRRTDPQGLLEKHSALKVCHKFFWHRWYMNSLYYRVFVDGMIKLSALVAKSIEDPMDRVYHKKLVDGMIKLSALVAEFIENPLDKAYHEKLPSLITKRTYNGLMHIRTETRELLYNVTYILIFFICSLFIILWVMR
jgi:NADH:ubiquinone oxidoreductase subunit 5 (subunit L)/multisubunit Na+/H+ antiporter MnhA subunit